MPFIPTNHLESAAIRVLKAYHPDYLFFEPQPVPVEAIIEHTFGLAIDYRYLREGEDVLGCMIYDDGACPIYDPEIENYRLIPVKANTMLIDCRLTEPDASFGRLRFTQAHELAHYVLHKGIYTNTNTAAALYAEIDDSDSQVEYQANYLARAILMPKGQIKRAYYTNIQKHGTKGLCDTLANIFAVSRKAMEIRLESMNLSF